MVNIMSVNGQRIETNKPGVSIINGMIVFGDGSTYNSSTGVFKNVGPGYVKLNGRLLDDPDSNDEQEEPTIKSFGDFRATDLTLSITSAKVTVLPHLSDSMRVEATGIKSLVDTVSVRLVGNTLTVTEEAPESSDNYSFFGQSIHIGGVISIGSSFGGASQLQIRIYVPVGTAIAAENNSGEIRIGDVRGAIDAEISGNGKIDVASAHGNVSLDISGNGDIKIRDGAIDALDVRISGNGDARVNGIAQHAKLRVSGNGTIKVSHVVNKPNKKISGNGTIKVRTVG